MDKEELIEKIEQEWTGYADNRLTESRNLAYKHFDWIISASALILSFSSVGLQIRSGNELSVLSKTFLGTSWVCLALSVFFSFIYIQRANKWLQTVGNVWSQRASDIFKIRIGKSASAESITKDLPQFSYDCLSDLSFVFFFSGFVLVVLFGFSFLK